MSTAKDCEIATELEQLAAFRNAKGSKASVFVDRQTNIPLPIMAEAPRPAAPALRLDRDGDTVMGGVNALSAVMGSVNAVSTATDVAAQISALSRDAARGRRGEAHLP
ncbi:hypothetical protein E4U32_001281 [Claviceps aff. humidiphila group G2b]|nr:hypothetical protein E4U32_001281 [Claviceps aff. humidiphila group G2b]